MAEFVAQEEMGRMTGYWWSHDESKIAFTKVDESTVAEVTRSEIYADEIKTIQQRYPFAGENNVKIELAIIELKSKEVRWVDLGKDTDIYLPRVEWTRDNNLLSYQWQSRDQKQLKLNLVDWQTMKSKTLIKETSKLLRTTPGINFIGNVEGRDVMSDNVDVVVTDGFTGNVVLKTLEGGPQDRTHSVV